MEKAAAFAHSSRRLRRRRFFAFFHGKQEDSDRCLHGATAWRKINENEEQYKYCLHIFKMNTLSYEESGRCNNLLPFSKLVFYHDF